MGSKWVTHDILQQVLSSGLYSGFAMAFQWVTIGNNSVFLRVAIGCTGLQWVSSEFGGLSVDLTGFYWVLLSFIGFNWV